jgi:hypothetical protein
MAGNQNSGGPRPTAPQNNPANVNALGGNGQSGRANQGTQAPKYIAGMAYGQGQATMAQQAGAPMAGPTPPPQAPQGRPMPSAIPLTEPTQRPNEPATAGANAGAGPGTEALTMPGQIQSPNDPDMDLIRNVFPIIELWAQQVDSSQGTKDYVNYLRTIL